MGFKEKELRFQVLTATSKKRNLLSPYNPDDGAVSPFEM
jgi:hypothetical protein